MGFATGGSGSTGGQPCRGRAHCATRRGSHQPAERDCGPEAGVRRVSTAVRVSVLFDGQFLFGRPPFPFWYQSSLSSLEEEQFLHRLFTPARIAAVVI